MTTATQTILPDLAGKTILYVRSRAYDNVHHELRERPQFHLEIGYGEQNADYMHGHKEFVRNFTSREAFEAVLNEAASLPGMQLRREDTFGERVFGSNGLVPDPVTTRWYSTSFYDELCEAMSGV